MSQEKLVLAERRARRKVQKQKKRLLYLKNYNVAGISGSVMSKRKSGILPSFCLGKIGRTWE